jgi:hypothetical protein
LTYHGPRLSSIIVRHARRGSGGSAELRQLGRLFSGVSRLNSALLKRLGHSVDPSHTSAARPHESCDRDDDGAPHGHADEAAYSDRRSEWSDHRSEWSAFVERLRGRCALGGLCAVGLPRVLCQNGEVAQTVPLIDYPSLVSRLYR